MFSFLSSPLKFVCPSFNFSKRFSTIHETWDMHHKNGRNHNTVDLISFYEIWNNSMVDERISEAGGQQSKFFKALK